LSKISVAAVGTGMWGRNIVRVLKELEGEGFITLEAVVDVREEVARSVAEEYGVGKYFTDPELIASLGIDAAVIAVPIDHLVKVGRILASLGVHIFVEKPVALMPNEIEDLIRIVSASGVVAQPGFIVRYDPVTKALKEELEIAGRVRYLIFKRLSRRPKHRMKFPIVYDLMIHDIDLSFYLAGRKTFRILSVHTSDIVDGVPQVVSAHIRLGSSHILLISDGLLPVKVREAEAITDTSYLKASYTDGNLYINSYSAGQSKRLARGEEPLKAELRDFIRRVKGIECPTAPTLEDALNALRVAYQIHTKEF